MRISRSLSWSNILSFTINAKERSLQNTRRTMSNLQRKVFNFPSWYYCRGACPTGFCYDWKETHPCGLLGIPETQQRLSLSWAIKVEIFLLHVLKQEISIMLAFIATSSIMVTYAKSYCLFFNFLLGARSLLTLPHVSLVKINRANCHFFYH